MSSRYTGREKPLLLVVDDDAMQRFLYREALEPNGFDVIEAADGGTAIVAFAKAKPDLVLLDVMMPDIDGFEVCRAIRALPAGVNTPVLLATGLDDLASIEASFDAGATDFVSKPISWGLLPHRVRYLLRSDEILQRFIASEKSLEEAQRIAKVGNFRWAPPNREIWGSPEAARIFGYDAAAGPISLRSILRRFPTSERRQLIAALRHLEQLGIAELDQRIELPGGETRYISLRVELYQSSTQPFIQGICHDITERKLFELQIQRARDEARESDAAKTTFLATMSHELRTPLNAVIGFAELLKAKSFDGPHSDQYLQYSNCILSAGQRMLIAINDILTMVRLTSGGHSPIPEICNLSALVESSVVAFRQCPEAIGRAISLEAPGGAVTVFADQRDVRRMLDNLLSNAVKFSSTDAPITVRVDRADDGHCRLSVEDQGIGMSVVEVARAVQAFRQVDERLARNSEGMGLGLSITSGLIESQGGSLEIVSEPNNGTRVILHFSTRAPSIDKKFIGFDVAA